MVDDLIGADMVGNGMTGQNPAGFLCHFQQAVRRRWRGALPSCRHPITACRPWNCEISPDQGECNVSVTP